MSENLIAKIPVNRQIIIIWDDEPVENNKLTQSQKEIAQNFLTAVQKIRKELTKEDKAALDELESGNYKPVFGDRSAEL